MGLPPIRGIFLGQVSCVLKLLNKGNTVIDKDINILTNHGKNGDTGMAVLVNVLLFVIYHFSVNTLVFPVSGINVSCKE